MNIQGKEILRLISMEGLSLTRKLSFLFNQNSVTSYKLSLIKLVKANMTMNKCIRQYQDSDLKNLMASWETANKLAHPFLKEDFVAQVRADIPSLYIPNADTWVVEVEGHVVGFMALLGNEIGAIFLQPAFHGKRIGKALMDKAQELHGDLEVEVFEENSIGRKFYSSYGFEVLIEKIHEETKNKVLRLKFTANQ